MALAMDHLLTTFIPYGSEAQASDWSIACWPNQQMALLFTDLVTKVWALLSFVSLPDNHVKQPH